MFNFIIIFSCYAICMKYSLNTELLYYSTRTLFGNGDIRMLRYNAAITACRMSLHYSTVMAMSQRKIHISSSSICLRVK